jgi:methyl-accepting chemotaxis protein
MQEGREQAKVSVEQAALAGSSLESITKSVATITDMNRHVADAAGQQGTVAEEINRNVASITEVAEQTAEGTQQLASASAQLTRLAEQLQSLVGRFQA